MGIVTTSIVVQFDTGAGGSNEILTAEVDGREDGWNRGNTSFRPGDDIYILLYASSGVSGIQNVVSQGYLQNMGTDNILVEDYAIFANENEVSFSKPMTSGWTYEWLGNTLGGIVLNGDLGVTLNISDAAAATPYAGLISYSYLSRATVYKLTNTLIAGKDKYSIIVFFYGETVE